MIDELIKLVREGFKLVGDHRKYKSTYSLEDLLSAGFAIFSLKELIVHQDGRQKNDCELNAAKRLIPTISQAMPHDRLLLTLDALYANAPLIRVLKEQDISLSHWLFIKQKGFRGKSSASV